MEQTWERAAIATTPAGRRGHLLVGLGVLLAIAVVGLFVVKWGPYYQRAILVSTTHTLGSSILTGKDAAPPPASLAAAWSYAVAYFNAVWQAMVLGLLLAATVEALLPRDWLARVLGSSRFRQTALGGLLGLPGMMCTCCASPLVVGMRKSGVSVGTALAFWLGNPTLNPAVLVFMVFALSWKWALLRLVLGVVLVFGVSWLVARLFGSATVSAEALAAVEAGRTDDPNGPALGIRWLRTLGRLAITLVPEYVAIVLVLGAARAWLFPAVGPELGNSLLVIVGLAIAGTLFTIPTAGELPIVSTMMGYGLGVGPAGALLMTLAPISLPSVAMVGRAFPLRVLVAVALAVVALGVVAGLAAAALAF